MTSTARLVDPAKLAASETICLAGELAAYARAASDAVAMIEAARLLATLPPEALAPGAATAPALFAEARLLTAGDRSILMEIDTVQYGYTRPIANCYAADSWVVRFAGNGVGLRLSTAPTLRFRVVEPVWRGAVKLPDSYFSQ